jgi:hypothetical protein
MSATTEKKAKSEKKSAKSESADRPTIQCVEQFNQHKLNYIVKNWDTKYGKGDSTKDGIFQKASEMLRQSINGKLTVDYQQSQGLESKGRFTAIGQASMQGLCKRVRDTITDEFMWDCDIANCHMSLTEHMSKVNDIECDQIMMYNRNRDECFKKMGIDKKKAKDIICALLNGGVSGYNSLPGKKPSFLKKIKEELQAIHQHFAKKFSDDFDKVKAERKKKDKDFSHEGALFGWLLRQQENKVLMAIHDYFDKPKNCVLMYDGIMLSKEE